MNDKELELENETLNPSCRVYHDLAMENCDLALLAKKQGDKAMEKHYLSVAYGHELRAAQLSRHPLTRQILTRSAATLAFQSGNNGAALTLIEKALAQELAPFIRDELTTLKWQIEESLAGKPSVEFQEWIEALASLPSPKERAESLLIMADTCQVSAWALYDHLKGWYHQDKDNLILQGVVGGLENALVELNEGTDK